MAGAIPEQISRSSSTEETVSDVIHAASDNVPAVQNNAIGNLAFLNDFINSRIEGSRSANSLTDEDRLGLLFAICQSLRNIFIPVSICMFLVVLIVTNFSYAENNYGVYFVYTPFREETASSYGQRAGFAIANSLIVVGVITGLTFLLVLLYYFECYKIIKGWVCFSTGTILLILSATFFESALTSFNVQLDLISFCFIVLNFGVPGMLAVHWKAPQILNQCYLVLASVFFALYFIKYLPDWTSWVFLGFIALYDIFAVLCPGGPLNLLIKLIQSRNRPVLDGLLYETWLLFSADRREYNPLVTEEVDENDVALEGSRGEANNEDANSNASTSPSFAGFKLGLGDFIFYSVLMGKTSIHGDYSATFSCYLAIISGLSATMVILMVTKRALPALPVSIALGIAVSFASKFLITPMMFFFTSRAVYL